MRPTLRRTTEYSAYSGRDADDVDKYNKPYRKDCIAVSVILFLIAIVGTPMVLYFGAVNYSAKEELTFQSKLPSHRAQEVHNALEQAAKNVPGSLTEYELINGLDVTPIVVLSTGNGRWNTGVWTGFGPEVVTLNWAAAGVVVDKSQCKFKCTFTDDQSKIPEAHAVLMELVNHPKFLGDNTVVPIPWPEKRQSLRAVGSNDAGLPLIGNFFYEPAQQYPKYTIDPELKNKVDFTVSPEREHADIPITLICPWGKSESDYLNPPPTKRDDAIITFFNEHGVAREYSGYIQTFLQEMGSQMHSYINYANKPMPDEAGGNPYQLSKRLEFTGSYKFVLITESMLLNDWVEPNWSQAFLAGVVPVYIGAPNIRDFTPGPKSFIDIREFKTPQDLANRLKFLAREPMEYQRYFDWKLRGLSESFHVHLNNCAHYAECRICEFTRRRLLENKKKADAAAEVFG